MTEYEKETLGYVLGKFVGESVRGIIDPGEIEHEITL
jgi:hypothetical protein